MPEMSDEDVQREYWNRELPAFDAIYSHEKSGIGNVLDSMFRQDMYQRHTETMTACAPIEGRSFLDVGCGTGLYALELAERGAAKVVGVDIAERMVDTCRERAESQGVENTIFVHGAVETLPVTEQYDVSIAIGLFDYLADAVPTLQAMSERTTGAVIATFPRLMTWRAPLRKIRLKLRGCPVYFYTMASVTKALTAAGLVPEQIRRLGKLYFVVARTSE